MGYDLAAVRADFPILERRVHGVPLVYLDSSNTSQKPNAVIEAVGSSATLGLAVALAGYAATIVMYGTASAGDHQAPFYELYRKELRLVNPRAAVGRDYDDAIAMVASGAVTGRPLVTGRLPLDAAPEVLGSWDRDPGRLKVVFEL